MGDLAINRSVDKEDTTRYEEESTHTYTVGEAGGLYSSNFGEGRFAE